MSISVNRREVDMDVIATARSIISTDLAIADRQAVTCVLSHAASLRRWLDGVEVACARRLAELAATTPSLSPEHDIAAATRRGIRHSNAIGARARTTSKVPELGDALADGDVSGEHVDAMTAAMNGLPAAHRDELASRGQRLALAASNTTPEEFRKILDNEARSIEADDGVERLKRQKRQVRLRTWTDRNSGMIRLSGEFDPETGMKLINRLEAALESLFHAPPPEGCPEDPLEKQAFLRAHALLNLINGTGPRCGKPEFIVVVDLETMQKGRHPGTRLDCGAGIDLPVDTLRDLAADAQFVPVLIDEHGMVIKVTRPVDSLDNVAVTLLNQVGVCLDLGRDARFASRDQRRALRAMYRHCPVPGCQTHISRTEPHHIVHWIDGGATDLAVLIPICKHHHDVAHAEGWTFTLAPDRSLTITFSDGKIMTTGPPTDQWK
jgi:Domain of unknown function (DUF222)